VIVTEDQLVSAEPDEAPRSMSTTGRRIIVTGGSFYHVKNGKMLDDYPGFDALSLDPKSSMARCRYARKPQSN
jgi:hypothetical protein